MIDARSEKFHEIFEFLLEPKQPSVNKLSMELEFVDDKP